MHNLQESQTEVMTRLSELESSPRSKFVVDQCSNPGATACSEAEPYHSAIALVDQLVSMREEPEVHVYPGTTRPSERLIHKDRSDYK